ncbi:MAG: hypothetical protein IPJ48_17105 [Propionivibrio sp.]|uniref:Uncharacterized protein n=1 Tax=Candidatus Propionivibrio dominans TaxID=2954373 RepID=A0A9D7F9Q5_9RHOO|nr:hypothetical protein [Candidatus Propionivibrio dominans]
MSKDRPTIGADGLALPILPPERDPRVWARLCRIMFYTPGFLALLLLKVGEPAGFGISVELLMLGSMSAIVGGLYIGTQSESAGADHSSRIGTWCGSLVLELLAVVPILCAVPSLFHELANSKLLHALTPGAVDISLGASELLPAVAILPFMLYQLAGFGTLHYIVSRPMNWAINIGILGLIIASTVANRQGAFGVEKTLVGVLVIAMVITLFYGVLKLRQMQTLYDANSPPKAAK